MHSGWKQATDKLLTLPFTVIWLSLVADIWSPPPPNNFKLVKCDAQFISSSLQEAIKKNVHVSTLACDCFFKLWHDGKTLV